MKLHSDFQCSIHLLCKIFSKTDSNFVPFSLYYFNYTFLSINKILTFDTNYKNSSILSLE